MNKKIMLLGSGELGKEFVISAKRLGIHVVAVDSYSNAPAMQVADEYEVIDMLNGEQLDEIVSRHKPDIIVPEIEAIRTEKLYDYENAGTHIVPSAKAVNYTMNRKAIRDLAARKLGLKTAKYHYAGTVDELKEAIADIGLPCVIKPLMSSSGKGQSVVKNENDIEKAWDYATNNSRGDIRQVIIEEFIDFHTEITLLTVSRHNAPTLYCPPVGHVQISGDYRESWQPVNMSEKDLKDAQDMADKITNALGGAGIWGVEFFLTNNGVVFSELSPRPHDTGMVTMAGTQNLNEFELHLRAILDLPINEITLERAGASAVVLADRESQTAPSFENVDETLNEKNTDIRIFGKPSTRKNRRMAVVVTYDSLDTDVNVLRERAKRAAGKIQIKY